MLDSLWRGRAALDCLMHQSSAHLINCLQHLGVDPFCDASVRVPSPDALRNHSLYSQAGCAVSPGLSSPRVPPLPPTSTFIPPRSTPTCAPMWQLTLSSLLKLQPPSHPADGGTPRIPEPRPPPSSHSCPWWARSHRTRRSRLLTALVQSSSTTTPMWRTTSLRRAKALPATHRTYLRRAEAPTDAATPSTTAARATRAPAPASRRLTLRRPTGLQTIRRAMREIRLCASVIPPLSDRMSMDCGC